MTHEQKQNERIKRLEEAVRQLAQIVHELDTTIPVVALSDIGGGPGE